MRSGGERGWLGGLTPWWLWLSVAEPSSWERYFWCLVGCGVARGLRVALVQQQRRLSLWGCFSPFCVTLATAFPLPTSLRPLLRAGARGRGPHTREAHSSPSPPQGSSLWRALGARLDGEGSVAAGRTLEEGDPWCVRLWVVPWALTGRRQQWGLAGPYLERPSGRQRPGPRSPAAAAGHPPARS